MRKIHNDIKYTKKLTLTQKPAVVEKETQNAKIKPKPTLIWTRVSETIRKAPAHRQVQPRGESFKLHGDRRTGRQTDKQPKRRISPSRKVSAFESVGLILLNGMEYGRPKDFPSLQIFVVRESGLRILKIFENSRIFTNCKTWNDLYIFIDLFLFCFSFRELSETSIFIIIVIVIVMLPKAG